MMATRVGMKEDVFTLKEGDAVFQWPERLSQESFEDLEAWTKLILRKVQRNVIKEEQPLSQVGNKL